MKRLILIVAAVLMGLSLYGRNAAAIDQLHFVDTVRSEGKKAQFMKALELAPQAFSYSDLQTDGKSYTTVIGLRFNESMRNALKSDIVAADPGLKKRMKRLFNVVRPFNAVGDLNVTYKMVPAGIAVEYHIYNLHIWGRKASLKEVKDIEKANSNAKAAAERT